MGTEHYVTVRAYRFDGEYGWSLFIMADPIEWRRELLDGGDSSLTGRPYISKSDRPYADGSSSHLQGATPRLASRGGMMSQTLHHRGAGLYGSC
jgi:hypothetical protein